MHQMIQRIVSIFLCVCLFAIMGCDEKAKQDAHKAQPVPYKPKPLAVKGLYIGMPIESVAAAVKEKFGGDWKLENQMNNTQERGYYITSESVSRAQKQFTMDDGVAVKCDAQGKVISIGFTTPAVNALFNAYDLQSHQFSQMFLDSYYDITKFEGIRGGWEWVKDDVRLRITNEKLVLLEKIIPRQQIQRNFN